MTQLPKKVDDITQTIGDGATVLPTVGYDPFVSIDGEQKYDPQQYGDIWNELLEFKPFDVQAAIAQQQAEKTIQEIEEEERDEDVERMKELTKYF